MKGSVLVTGAGRRIGRTLAARFAEAGFAVAIHHHGAADEARALADEILAGGGAARAVGADLRDLDALPGLVAAAAALGPPTLLVNCAAIFEEDAFETLAAERFERHLAINLRAPVFLAQAFAAAVPEGRPASIVNIVDQRVLRPTPLFFSYALSKAALHAATRTMALALAPRGIRVNAIGPGPALPSARQAPEDFARQEAALPLRAGTDPDEIAAAILFLHGSSSVTGQMLALDGGQHLAWETPDVAGIRE